MGETFRAGAVGCYSLHLYCVKDSPLHEYGEFPHEYVDELGSRCRSAARRDGWVIVGGYAVCPKCSGKAPRLNDGDTNEHPSND